MKPYFIWDYDIDEKEVRKIIKSGDEFSRLWLIARILESAKFQDVWHYLTLKQVWEVFPKLKLKTPIKDVWEKAFYAWGLYENTDTSAKRVS